MTVNVTVLRDAGKAKEYYSYYVMEGEERVALVGGKLMEPLGITGFNKQEFFDMCEGLHPKTGKKLTPGNNANRRVGMDVTANVPKGVSAVIELLQDKRAFDVVNKANQFMMRTVEEDIATRIRTGGANHDLVTGNAIWYSFYDEAARPVDGIADFHSHWHNVLMNVTWNPKERKYKAIQMQEWEQNGNRLNRPYYQEVFLNEVQRGLEEIGYKTNATEHGFDIVGIPEEILTEFSRRTAQVDARKDAIEARFNTKISGKKKGELAAETRGAKLAPQSRDAMLRGWLDRVSPENLAKMVATYRASLESTEQRAIQNEANVELATEHVLHRASTAPVRELLLHALRFGRGHVTLDGLKEQLNKPEFVLDTISGTPSVTHKAVQAEEQKIVDFAIAGRGRVAPMGKPGWSVPDTLTPGKHEPPTKGQAEAFRHLLTSPDRFMLIVGKAGVGKTKMLRAAMDQAVVEPVVLAASSDAVAILCENGFPQAQTLAKFRVDKELQEKARGGTVLVDEIGMAGSMDIASLVESVDQLGARVIATGDIRQHKSVGRGHVMKLVMEKTGIPIVQMNEVLRQKGDLLEVTEHLADGRMKSGMDKLDSMGAIVETPNYLVIPAAERAADGLPLNPIERYVELSYNRFERGGKVHYEPTKDKVIFIDPTHKDGAAATAAIRSRLKDIGVLDKKDRDVKQLVDLKWSPAQIKAAKARGDKSVVFGKFSAYREERMPLAKGDKIRITGWGMDVTKKHELRNGQIHEVADVTDGGQVTLANGWVLPEDFGHLRPGYVDTTFSSQSKTKDHVIAINTTETLGAVDMPAAYVEITRAAKSAMVYTDSREKLLHYWDRLRPHTHASDMGKRKKPRFRDRLRKHIAFLKATVSLGAVRQAERDLTMGRGHGYER